MLSQQTHKKPLPIFLWGLLVSFLGSLPPGTTNVIMVQLSITRGYEVATWFAIGCMLAEILCVSLCLTIMERILRSPTLTQSLEWVSLFVIVWIFASSFAGIKDPTHTAVPLLLSPFLSGLILMAINPVQLPFWVGWTTILNRRNILQPSRRNHILYVTGIAIGSIVASAIFISGGRHIAHWMIGKERIVQITFAAILLLIAAVQVVKIILRQSAYRSAGR